MKEFVVTYIDSVAGTFKAIFFANFFTEAIEKAVKTYPENEIIKIALIKH